MTVAGDDHWSLSVAVKSLAVLYFPTKDIPLVLEASPSIEEHHEGASRHV